MRVLATFTPSNLQIIDKLRHLADNHFVSPVVRFQIPISGGEILILMARYFMDTMLARRRE